MTNTKKLALWGSASAVIFAALFFVQSVFSSMVTESDQGTGSQAVGTALLIVTVVLVVGFVVTATMFFRSFATALAERRSQE